MLETLEGQARGKSGTVQYVDPDIQRIHEKVGVPYQATGEIQLAYALAYTAAHGLIVVKLDTGEVLYGHAHDKVFTPTEVAAINRMRRVVDCLWLPK